MKNVVLTQTVLSTGEQHVLESYVMVKVRLPLSLPFFFSAPSSCPFSYLLLSPVIFSQLLLLPVLSIMCSVCLFSGSYAAHTAVGAAVRTYVRTNVYSLYLSVY